MFKLQIVFVRSDAGGGEGELGSVLLSVRRGSLRVCTKHGARVLGSAFPRLVFECFKLF